MKVRKRSWCKNDHSCLSCIPEKNSQEMEIKKLLPAILFMTLNLVQSTLISKTLLKPKLVFGLKNLLPFPLFPIIVGDPLREAAAFGAGAIAGHAGGSVSGAFVGSKATKLLKSKFPYIKPVPLPLPLPLPLPIPFPINFKFPKITVSKETVEDYPKSRKDRFHDDDEVPAASYKRSASVPTKATTRSTTTSSTTTTERPGREIRITFG